MRTITALFVGLGSIGTRHLKNLANLCADRGWTLQADALRSDLTRPLRPGAAELLHAQYTDLAAAPAHYDMVFITNPTSLHAEALRQVKGRGEALFIEKPIFSAEQTGLALDECFDRLDTRSDSDLFAYECRRENDGSFLLHLTLHQPSQQPLDTLYTLRLDPGRQTVVTLIFIREAFGYKEPLFPPAMLDEFMLQKLDAHRTK